MGVLSLVMIGVASLFQVNTRMGQQQLQTAEMQQAARGSQNELVRMVRMAGRGGLMRGLAPDFLPVAVRNNVSDNGPDRNIAVGDGASPRIRPGTDVLTVRGVINSPLYQVAESSMFLDNPAAPTTGTVRITNPSPVGVTQDLSELAHAIQDGTAEPLIVVSAVSDQIYAVVELAPGKSAVDDFANPTEIVAGFDVGVYGGTSQKDHYMGLSAGATFSSQLRTPVFVGLLEEYRYFVREQLSDPGDQSSPVVPRLARARFFPATETAHPSSPGMDDDVADGVVDLQVAIGIDTGGDGLLDEVPASPTATDDWLFNAGADDPVNAAHWNQPSASGLFHLRITTLTRTDRPDPLFSVDPINRIEDHFYSETSAPANEAERRERLHRRRLLSTVVDLRNQG